MASRVACVAAALLLSGQGAGVFRAGAQPAAGGAHVVLVTIDGLRGDYLGSADAYGLRLPVLRRLMREGAYSPRTLSVYPTLTGTAHTTLVTGTGAAGHGILGNNRFDPAVWVFHPDNPDNYDRQPPFREHAEIRAPTLWQAARARGLTSAAINWPQTAGGPIDYRLDIAVAPTGAESRERILRSAAPAGGSPPPWIEAVERRLGPLQATDLRMADRLKALVGAEILRQFRPALLAVHFTLTDSVQHAEGPLTPAAFAALEEADANLADLVAAIRAAGLEGATTLVVTGDHGFLPMHTELAINLPLVETGLVTEGAGGRLVWRAMVAPNRGLGSLYVRNGDAEAAARARQALEAYAARYPGRFRIVERAELDAWRADRDAVIGIEPEIGYVLDGRLQPPFARPHARAAGHGYRPDRPGMETGLVLHGARVRPGRVLPVTQAIDIAPTIALLLDLDLSGADGRPLVGALENLPRRRAGAAVRAGAGDAGARGARAAPDSRATVGAGCERSRMGGAS